MVFEIDAVVRASVGKTSSNRQENCIHPPGSLGEVGAGRSRLPAPLDGTQLPPPTVQLCSSGQTWSLQYRSMTGTGQGSSSSQQWVGFSQKHLQHVFSSGLYTQSSSQAVTGSGMVRKRARDATNAAVGAILPRAANILTSCCVKMRTGAGFGESREGPFLGPA